MRNCKCVYCKTAPNDIHYTFFASDRQALRKQRLKNIVGQVTPDNVVSLMLKNEDDWTVATTYIEGTLCRKEREEELFDEVTDITEG